MGNMIRSARGEVSLLHPSANPKQQLILLAASAAAAAALLLFAGDDDVALATAEVLELNGVVLRPANPQPFQTDTTAKRVILHVGPHKTGTTFLQNLLLLVSPILQSDNYVTPGAELSGLHQYAGMNKYAANVAQSLNAKESLLQPNPAKTLKEFESFLSKAHADGRSVVLSSEEFDKEGIDRERLFKYFRGRWESVEVVVTYRRLYEWYYSLYSFLHKGRTSTDEWPTFVDWWRGGQAKHFASLEPSKVRKRYETVLDERTDSVYVHNYHYDTLIEEDFFCNAIPDANATCAQIRDGPRASPANTGQSLEIRRLALAAQEAGVASTTIALDIFESKLMAYFFNEPFNPYDHPLWQCLDQQETRTLLLATLNEERRMVPEWHASHGGEEALRHDFAEFRKAGHLCSIDTTKAISDISWSEIFTTM